MNKLNQIESEFTKLQIALDEFTNSIVDIFTPLIEILNSAFNDIKMSIMNEDWLYTPEFYERRSDESILKWGIRLDAFGVLDNPDIRWQYQKACLLWVASPVIRVWRKLRG